jgi:hypothetical protein
VSNDKKKKPIRIPPEAAMPPAAQERWALLAGIPKVVDTEEAKGKRLPVSISVARDEPP